MSEEPEELKEAGFSGLFYVMLAIAIIASIGFVVVAIGVGAGL